MIVKFPRWPVWNYPFPELDVKRIVSVNYFDELDSPQTLDAAKYRLSIGRNGVSGLTFLAKSQLPALRDRVDAVSVEYEV